MKKIFTLFILSSLFISAFAQLSSGFYRVKNADTGRYIYVCDNKGKAELDGAMVKTDLDAIYLRADLKNTISDPGSIIYVDKVESEYDFLSQGTSVHKIIGHYVSLVSRSGHYAVGATVHGVAAYLSDAKTNNTSEYGIISIDSNGKKLWDPVPVSPSSNNYFGVSPTISCEGKYYSSFYASFGFSPVSNATKVYCVSAVKEGGAVLLSEIQGDVPAATPVIVECESSSPADNKLDLKLVNTTVPSNKLKGVYFDTDNSRKSYAAKIHKNQTPVTDNIRILTVDEEGNLVFAKSSLKNIPANSSYLEVSSRAVDNLVVFFSKAEFDDFVGVDALEAVSADSESLDVYNLLGKKVESTRNLPSGIYIIGGKKTVIR